MDDDSSGSSSAFSSVSQRKTSTTRTDSNPNPSLLLRFQRTMKTLIGKFRIGSRRSPYEVSDDEEDDEQQRRGFNNSDALLQANNGGSFYGSIDTIESPTTNPKVTLHRMLSPEEEQRPYTSEATQGASAFLPSAPLTIQQLNPHVSSSLDGRHQPGQMMKRHSIPALKIDIPTVNVQDCTFLTVNEQNRFMGGGSHSPGRRASFSGEFGPGGPVSPTPTFASSFEFQNQPSRKFSVRRIVKIALLVAVFLAAATLITMGSEKHLEFVQATTQENKPFQLKVKKPELVFQDYPILSVTLKGPFVPDKYINVTDHQLIVSVEEHDALDNIIRTVSKKWRLGLVLGENAVPESTRNNLFNLEELPLESWKKYALVFRTNSQESVPFSVSVRLVSEGIENGAVYGGAVLVGLYVLIIFELVNRTLAAMLSAAVAIAILSFLNERPSTEEMVSWLDMETLILLFSMMVMVAIFCETGFFDYSAYLMYKLANGKVWPLITGLCAFTAFVSAFLDNVTTVLLMTPVTIRICEAMTLNPVPVLISIVIFSNIGGAVTPVGDPPNVIIANNANVKAAGIDFAVFSLHMLLGIIPIIFISYLHLRLTFRSMKSLQFSEPREVTELRREIEVWLRTLDSLSSYSKDESHVRTMLQSKISHLKGQLKHRIRMGGQTEEGYRANLLELELSCKIQDWPLLIKCGIVLTTVIIMFFLHSVPQLNLSLGWTALLGAVFLLILADRRELEGIFTRVEWSTLIFFSALFIVMEAVSKLGLLSWIGQQTEEIISDVNPESRLAVAIALILWVSGLASAFIDNIPFTTMMIQIVTSVAERVNLPLQPLIWALAFGTCLGGNGTLIGASANVVCAGVADQHGYRFTFMEFFRIGFPMTIVSLIVATAYLMICHIAIGWNG